MNISKIIIYLKILRAPFFTASFVPILVGTAAAYAAKQTFDLLLFILALFSMTAFQAGANIINDYFDHLSNNDWLNENPTPFSGGSRVIQQKLLSPVQVFRYGIFIFALAISAGLVIVFITKSIFILLIGLIGFLGAYFYTAKPLKLGYRTFGEITIAFLFGILPVFGSYYIQTNRLDLYLLIPSIIVAMLIFQIILANEFPDYAADKAANKRTIVVTFGIDKAASIYRVVLRLICVVALIDSMLNRHQSMGSITASLTIILMIFCEKKSTTEALSQNGTFALSRVTVLLHLIVGFSLAASLFFS